MGGNEVMQEFEDSLYGPSGDDVVSSGVASGDKEERQAYLRRTAKLCHVRQALVDALENEFPDYYHYLGEAHKTPHLELARASGEYKVLSFISTLCKLYREGGD